MKKLIIASLMLSACAPTLMQTARTNGAGKFQAAVEPGVAGIQTDNGGGFIPTLNVSGRYGVTDKIDVGARIGTIGYGLQGKFAFTDPSDEGAMQIALVPEVGFVAGGGGGTGGLLGRFNVGVLFGIPLGQNELTLGALLGNTLAIGGNAGGYSGNLGVSAGMALKLGDKFRIMPEVGFKPLFIGAAAGGGTSGGGIGFLGTYSVGCGFMFGGR